MLEHHTGIDYIDKGTFTFSHEVTGIAVKNGEGSNAKLGQLYVVLGMNPCFNCKFCKAGRENMCKSERKMIGLGLDGGNAEYCVVREAICIPVPKGVTAGAAASASDAILTPYHAIKTIGKLQKDQGVSLRNVYVKTECKSVCVVIGLGGLGLNAVSIALMVGAKVYGVDLKKGSIDAAVKLGAEAMTMDELLKKFEDEGLGADLVVDAVGAAQDV